MRFVITGFLALLLWGCASFFAADVGITKWIPAVCLALTGLIVQLVYARLVNRHFNNIGMSESVRVRIRNDRGVVPFWIVGIGIIARSLMLAGTVFPLLEAIGCIVRGSGSV